MAPRVKKTQTFGDISTTVLPPSTPQSAMQPQEQTSDPNTSAAQMPGSYASVPPGLGQIPASKIGTEVTLPQDTGIDHTGSCERIPTHNDGDIVHNKKYRRSERSRLAHAEDYRTGVEIFYS
ncbi:hypothetical protein CVT24_009760 [Panaeolus cyanescens]|uniref:Uncharacterized protein n=1 Tax=Panaeolus cyanescens TaxID=181874 RepID=A0A409WF58_9AGAR|nr:hypothetical protein CVT24_009760 [Panaeolus cyanescens]